MQKTTRKYVRRLDKLRVDARHDPSTAALVAEMEEARAALPHHQGPCDSGCEASATCVWVQEGLAEPCVHLCAECRAKLCSSP